MAGFSRWSAVGSCAVVGCFGLLSSCGESASNGNSSKPGDGGASGEPSSNGGTAARAGSGGRAGSSQGGTNNQAGSPEGTAGDAVVMNGGAPSAGAPAGGASSGDAGASDTAGAGGEAPVALPCTDQDGDGYGDGGGCLGPDCDDLNPLVNPGMLELADDGNDNDCTAGDLKAATGPGYYVNGSDANCSDANGAVGTKLAPYCTIELAVVRAYQATAADDAVGRSIFVAQGAYPNTVGTPRSMRVYGGYDASDWSYDPAQNVTILGGADVMKDVDDFSGLSSWLSVNVKANAVIQGFHIQGGIKAGAPIFAVEINSSGKVELYDNVIVAGSGAQTLAVSIVAETKTDLTTSNVWLLKNRISAGVPTTSSNYGVNNLGTAVLWGNVIDMGQGSGQALAFGAAVQNYGHMTLVNNVLNGGSYGTVVDGSYGLINAKADGLPDPGVAFAYGNVIFGGRGSVYSIGVRNNAELTLVNNVLGDRTPGPLTFAQAPTTLATPLDTGFAAKTTLSHNDLVQLIYSDEASPPNAAAHRELFRYSDQTPHPVNSLSVVNGCTWTGCVVGSGQNLAVDPGFVGGADFHLENGSALISKGTDPGRTTARGLANLDIDGTVRPSPQWDIGIDER